MGDDGKRARAVSSGQSQSQGQQNQSSDKNWMDQLGLNETLDQIPQSVKDFGSKAVSQVGRLTVTQQIVGGAPAHRGA